MASVDEERLLAQVVDAHSLILRAVIAAVGDPQHALTLFDESITRVHALAAADGLTPAPKPTHCRVDGLTPDEHGIVSVKHNLGAERVQVHLFAADGAPRKHRRIGIPIDENEVEVIAESLDVAYAEVEAL